MIYRNSDPNVLYGMAYFLRSEGFSVSEVVVPKNKWVDGEPYFETSASAADVMRARRDAVGGSHRGRVGRRKKSYRAKRVGALRAPRRLLGVARVPTKKFYAYDTDEVVIGHVHATNKREALKTATGRWPEYRIWRVSLQEE